MSSRNTRLGPIPDSYWLIDGMLLAGEYPATYRADATREKPAKFLDTGILTFINLTEESEPLAEYDGLLRELSEERKICWFQNRKRVAANRAGES